MWVTKISRTYGVILRLRDVEIGCIIFLENY